MIHIKNDDDFVFYVPFNIIYVISRWWKGDNERLYAMKHYTVWAEIHLMQTQDLMIQSWERQPLSHLDASTHQSGITLSLSFCLPFEK